MKKILRKKYIAFICLLAMILSVIAPISTSYADEAAQDEVVNTMLENSENEINNSQPSEVQNESFDKNIKSEVETKTIKELNKVEKTNLPRKVIQDVITSMQVTDLSGKPLTGSVSQWDSFRINAEFKIPNNIVKEGDTSTIKLPKEIKFDGNLNFEVKDPLGNIVANAVIDSVSKTVTLTYTNYVESHSDVQGRFFFYATVDTKEVVSEQKIELNFEVDGKVIPGGSIEYGPEGPEKTDVIKSGWQDDTDKQLLHYYVAVNRKSATYPNVVLKDTLQNSALEFVEGSFSIQKGKWEIKDNNWSLAGSTDVTKQYTINNTGNSFSIDLGNINGEGYILRYSVKINYKPVDGEVFKNKVELISSDKIINSTSLPIQIKEAGGEAEGYNFSINIHKKDELGNSLEGAEFKIIRDRNNNEMGSIVTDAEGKASIGKLLRDNYTIIETKAPEGYELSNEEIKIKPEDFGSTKEVFKEIINKKIELVKVEGSKIWDDGNDQDGKRPSSIKIDLYKTVGTGSPTKVDEVEVTPDANGNWNYSFVDLPKYEGGELITYSVKEQQILDYTSKVEGFDITNSYTPGETEISVIKSWNDEDNQDGKRPTNIKVDLYKTVDGVETKLDAETQTLSEGNNWSYTWTGLPEKEAGKTITYTVKEVDVPEDYTSTQKTENGVVTITNSYTPETTKVEGQKLWDDGNDQDGKRSSNIVVELYKTVEDQTIKVDEVEVTPDANGDWKYNFTNLPKYANGEEILYSVKEQAVEDYTNEIKDFDITNSYTPGKTEIEVIKNWNDKEDQDKIRPTSIEVELYARESGADKEGNLVDTVKLSDKNNWSHKWTDLDTHKDKKELEYYVVEKEVPEGYEVTYKVNSITRTVFITNSHTPVEPPTPEEPGKPWLPKTGITGIAGLGILGMSLIGFGAVQFKKKK